MLTIAPRSYSLSNLFSGAVRRHSSNDQKSREKSDQYEQQKSAGSDLYVDPQSLNRKTICKYISL